MVAYKKRETITEKRAAPMTRRCGLAGREILRALLALWHSSARKVPGPNCGNILFLLNWAAAMLPVNDKSFLVQHKDGHIYLAFGAHLYARAEMVPFDIMDGPLPEKVPTADAF